MRVMLVFAPWHEASAPSIQIATLKSYLQENGVPCTAKHYHAAMAGILRLPLYQTIVRENCGEALFSRHLYPQGLGHAGRTVDEYLAESGLSEKEIAYADSGIRALRDLFLKDVADWAPDIIGFSLTYMQLSASLYLAKEIKKAAPAIQVVFGGLCCSGEMGRSLIEVFDSIDFVVSGEGELSLLGLLKAIQEGREPDARGVFYRAAGGVTSNGPAPQFEDLDDLPYPDFTEYFQQAAAADVRLVYELPIESGRGCWWGRCKFCSFNVGFSGYRHKSPERVARELEAQARKYRNLRFTFMDNIPPKLEFVETVRRIRACGLDFSIFRFSPRNGHTPREFFREMRAAGVRMIQPGIESFSSSLLRKMAKGVRCIDNLRILKRCKEAGIHAGYNLIPGFPGETREELEETLAVCRSITHFDRPNAFSPFTLQYASPVYCNPEAFGITAVRPHETYSYQFPREILERLVLFQYEYDGRSDPSCQEVWQEIAAIVEDWGESKSQLVYQDGRDFLVITDTRARSHRRIVLGKTEREIFLSCDDVQSIHDIAQANPDISSEEIKAVLDALVGNNIVFQEDGSYLALPVRDIPVLP